MWHYGLVLGTFIGFVGYVYLHLAYNESFIASQRVDIDYAGTATNLLPDIREDINRYMIIYIVTYINLEIFHTDWLWAQFLKLPEESQQDLIVNRNEEFGFGYEK